MSRTSDARVSEFADEAASRSMRRAPAPRIGSRVEREAERAVTLTRRVSREMPHENGMPAAFGAVAEGAPCERRTFRAPSLTRSNNAVPS